MGGRLVLVKHAPPEIDPARPRATWQLSTAGRERARHLADALRGLRPCAVYASREPKAVATARIVGDALGLAVEERDGLEEHDDAGTPFLGEAAFVDAVRRFFAEPEALVYGRETAAHASARFGRAIGALPPPAEARSLVVVSHGRVVSAFVARRNGLDAFALWRRLGLPSFVVLGYPELRVEEVVESV